MSETVVFAPAVIDLTITGRKDPSGMFLKTTGEELPMAVTSMSPPVPI